MKTRKILSALLAVLVCATMAVSLASCGDDEKTTGEDTTDTTAAEVDDDADDAGDTEAPVDGEGETEPEVQE